MDIGHWRVELETRLDQAKQKKELLNEEIIFKQQEIEKINRYVNALIEFLKLEDELSSGTIGMSQSTNITDTLVLFANQKPDKKITVKEGIAQLISRGLYSVDKGSANSVYGIFSHRDDLFMRVDSGTYKLTDKAIEQATYLMQPKLSGITKMLRTDDINKKERHNPIATFLLSALKEKDSTLQELTTKALDRGFTFPGKNPGRVVHWSLVAMSRHKSVERVNGLWRLKRDTTNKSIAL